MADEFVPIIVGVVMFLFFTITVCIMICCARCRGGHGYGGHPPVVPIAVPVPAYGGGFGGVPAYGYGGGFGGVPPAYGYGVPGQYPVGYPVGGAIQPGVQQQQRSFPATPGTYPVQGES